MFKKKDAIVKDDAKVEAADKPVKKSGKKKPVSGRSNKNIFSWSYQLALFPLVALAVAYVLIDQLSISQNESDVNDLLNQQRLSSLSNSVEEFFHSKKLDVQNLASLTGGSESLTLSELNKLWPDLSSLYRFPGQNIQSARQAYPDLTFASVDLIRRSFKKGKTLVELFFYEGSWYLQVAVPASTDKVPGSNPNSLLAVFDLSDIESRLKRSDVAQAGAIQLLSGADKALLSVGKPASAIKLKKALSVAGLAVVFSPNAPSFVVDKVMIILILAAIGVLLAIIQLLIARQHLGKVRQDILRVSSSVGKLSSGTKQKVEFVHGEFLAMSQAVIDQTKQLVEKSKKAAETAAMSESKIKGAGKAGTGKAEFDDDAPLFDEDLDLDLDALGDQFAEDETELVTEVSGLDIDVPQSIFRAYDIRGVVDETLNDSLVELIGKSVASEAILQGQKAICVGYDARHSSAPYSEALLRGILSTGLDVINVGQVPTPILYFSTHHYKTGSGIMITGSHNPANYNGFKIVLDGKTLYGDDIQKIYNRILLRDFETGQGSCTESDVSQAYMDTILNDIAVAAPLKVVLDAGNGVAGNIGPQLIEELGCEVIPLHCEIDGNFPNHHPDPSKPENLTDLIAAVQAHDADIGLAFDGDADRLGVVTNTGKIIWSDRLLMLFAKDVVSRNPGADILFDVKCSRRLNGLISSYGGRPVMWKSGHSLIKAKMKETGALLAGEMSGHIFFKERWFGFDDGLYCAARLLEVLGIEDRSSDEVFADFPEDVSTPEINIDVSDDAKFTIVESLCALKDQFVGGNASTIDGLRVEYPNGWGLCRASNTTPSIMLRFEADDDAALEEIKSVFRSQLQIVDPSIVCDF